MQILTEMTNEFADAVQQFSPEQISEYFENTSKTIEMGSFGAVDLGM